VEIFSAQEDGKLEVKLIPKGSADCRVLIKNVSDQPLNVTLPEAFAGVPVLAQQFGANMMNNSAGAPQQLGIGNPFGRNSGLGFPNRGGNRGGNQMFNVPMGRNNLFPNFGQNFAPFNVAPEKVAQLKLKSVCLEHGKPTPRPAMRYEIRPIEAVTDKAEVHELCRMLGRGEVSQRVAQAAAWHLANDMSWQELAALKKRVLPLGRIPQPFFAPVELVEGKKAVDEATERTRTDEQNEPTYSLSRR
jgi:hypothetical protein